MTDLLITLAWIIGAVILCLVLVAVDDWLARRRAREPKRDTLTSEGLSEDAFVHPGSASAAKHAPGVSLIENTAPDARNVLRRRG